MPGSRPPNGVRGRDDLKRRGRSGRLLFQEQLDAWAHSRCGKPNRMQPAPSAVSGFAQPYNPSIRQGVIGIARSRTPAGAGLLTPVRFVVWSGVTQLPVRRLAASRRRRTRCRSKSEAPGVPTCQPASRPARTVLADRGVSGRSSRPAGTESSWAGGAGWVGGRAAIAAT
jgi:hypothetical protein